MKELFQNTKFSLGFWGMLSLCILFNFASFLMAHNENSSKVRLDHVIHETGFPFTLWIDGGQFPTNQFIWSGVVANIFAALVFSFAGGVTFNFVWSKLFSQKLR